MIQARKLGHVVLKVRDAGKSKEFYTRALGLKVAYEQTDWGAVFLSETVVAIQLLGIAIVLVSVGVIVRSSARPPAAPTRPRRQRSLVGPSPSPACSLRSSSSS